MNPETLSAAYKRLLCSAKEHPDIGLHTVSAGFIDFVGKRAEIQITLETDKNGFVEHP